MLVLLTCEQKNHQAYTKSVVLNTDFLGELRVHSSTKAKFKYFGKTEDRRGGYDIYEVAESLATIRNWMDLPLEHEYLTVYVYPDDDTTKDTVLTVFNADEVVKALPYPASPHDTSWLWVNEKGFKVRRYLIDQYFVDIVDIVKTGSTTTTTSTTTCPPTTSTSTTTTTTSTTTKSL